MKIKKLPESDYVGKLGDKIHIKLSRYSLLSCWDNPFGITYLYEFRDVYDNVYIWKTSRPILSEISEVTGRLINYTEYNGIKENVLNYCRCK